MTVNCGERLEKHQEAKQGEYSTPAAKILVDGDGGHHHHDDWAVVIIVTHCCLLVSLRVVLL